VVVVVVVVVVVGGGGWRVVSGKSRSETSGGWYLCVVAVLRFRCWIGHEHILLGSTMTYWALLSLA
jgi:hypothetical protein